MGSVSAFIVGVTFPVHLFVERPAAFLLRKLIDYGELSLARSRFCQDGYSVFANFSSHAATWPASQTPGWSPLTHAEMAIMSER